MKINSKIYEKEDYDIYSDPNTLIVYVPSFNEYGIIIHDWWSSFIIINYCPWCWKKLPESLRDKRFDELERMWYENPLLNDNIPEEFKTDEWFRK